MLHADLAVLLLDAQVISDFRVNADQAELLRYKNPHAPLGSSAAAAEWHTPLIVAVGR